MLYQGKEILSKKSVFGKQIAEVKILSTGEVKSEPISELSIEKKLLNACIIAFKAIAAKIKSEVFKQAMLAPIERNIVPLPHQILALEKVIDWTYYYPHNFTSPFAAYLGFTQNIKIGERVFIENLIEDYVSAS